MSEAQYTRPVVSHECIDMLAFCHIPEILTCAFFPLYMVVENTTWIEEGYKGQSRKIQIPISEFEPKEVSFTYPDSMISYWLKDKKQAPFYQPDYHGQVFRLDEIIQVIKKYRIPVEEWKTQKARKHDIFIEAQIWNEQAVLNYLKDKV